MSQAIKHVAPIKTPKSEKICVIIPGAGDKMKSSGPQSLLKIKNKSLIEHQLDVLTYNLPNYYVVFVSGFESNVVMDAMPNSFIKVENERYDKTSVLRSICLGLRATVCNRVLIMYGNVLCTKNTLDYDFTKSAVWLDSTIDKDIVGAHTTNNKIPQLMYSLEHKWGQMLYLTGKELDLFRSIAYKKQNEKHFTFEAINQVIEKGGSIKGISNPDARIRDIGCNKDIKNITEIINENHL